jgi:hypothetical protein
MVTPLTPDEIEAHKKIYSNQSNILLLSSGNFALFQYGHANSASAMQLIHIGTWAECEAFVRAHEALRPPPWTPPAKLTFNFDLDL